MIILSSRAKEIWVKSFCFLALLNLSFILLTFIERALFNYAILIDKTGVPFFDLSSWLFSFLNYSSFFRLAMAILVVFLLYHYFSSRPSFNSEEKQVSQQSSSPNIKFRILAKIIDEAFLWITIALLILVLFFIRSSWLGVLELLGVGNFSGKVNFDILSFYLLFSFFYYFPLWREGQTLGMRLFNLVVVSENGKLLTQKQAIVRFFLDLFAKIALGFPYLTIFFSSQRLTLIDKLSQTRVFSLKKE